MIYHLSTSGTPISWSIIAIYERSLGIASASAKTWHEQTTSPQCLIKIENGKAECLEMYWTDQGTQNPQDHGMVVSGFKGIISGDERGLIERAVRHALIGQGYFIPREEWELRYPASKLVSDRFREFSQACAALDKDLGHELPFEDKWVMFMPAPEGFVFPYRVGPSGKGYGLIAQRNDEADPTSGKVWREIDDANAACRLLNSGWDWEQTQVLLALEPIEPNAATLEPRS